MTGRESFSEPHILNSPMDVVCGPVIKVLYLIVEGLGFNPWKAGRDCTFEHGTALLDVSKYII